jgi:hypothetical protein
MKLFTFARTSRRDARADSCEPRIYFSTLQDLSNVTFRGAKFYTEILNPKL